MTDSVPPCFFIDCTPNPRPYSKTLCDKSIVYAPNPAPGNKPICVGHSYSCIALKPSERKGLVGNWLIPLSVQRVKSNGKGHEVGMQQLPHLIENLNLTHDLTVSVGDTSYGSEACREIASRSENLVHICRLNSKRSVYSMPDNGVDKHVRRGRKKEYGEKIALSALADTEAPTSQATAGLLTRNLNMHQVTITAWNNKLMRGSKTFKGHLHPMTIVRIEVTDKQGRSMYKRPLWIAAQGLLRHQITLASIYHYYRDRYDIEHFFRFGKSNLLINAYQTPDVTHEENWWRLCLVAYCQLFMAKSIVAHQLKPWEKYLYVYKERDFNPLVSSPSQTQRGFAAVLNDIGTPAKPCKVRGTASGRKKGQKPEKRPELDVIFKTRKAMEAYQNLISLGFDKTATGPEPKEIYKLAKMVLTTLKKYQFDKQKFTNLLCDTG